MKPGREIDVEIAQQVFGHAVRAHEQELWEDAPEGARLLRHYGREIAAAWEVAEKMNITLIPVEEGKWFAMVGQAERWSGPAEFLQFLQAGNFVSSGAAVADQAAVAICIAALKAIEQRKLAAVTGLSSAPAAAN